MKKLNIQLLHSESCHSYQKALAEIYKARDEFGLMAEVEVILVDSQEKALDYKFLGSPTIKINGTDLEPELEATGNFTTDACRAYFYEGSLYDYPPKEMLINALKPFAVFGTK